MQGHLLDMGYDEIFALLKDMGEPAYRGVQVFSWINKGAGYSDMANIPKSLRERLAAEYPEGHAEMIRKQVSELDGTTKYLFKTYGGSMIESVVMEYRHGRTICISTQEGCRMGCLFCASTIGGMVRNLEAGEMLSQVVYANRDMGGERALTNIVLMGSGEPLENYNETIRFLRLVHDERGLGVSYRNISLSTCGVADGIRRLADEGMPVTLCLSLHAPDDALRKTIMPGASRYPISEILDAVKSYFKITGRRIIIEYVLIQGVNDDEQHAIELSRLLSGMTCHVNLIKLNSVEESPLQGSTDKAAALFLKTLADHKISATRRRTMGADIDGACGQLRRREENREKENWE